MLPHRVQPPEPELEPRDETTSRFAAAIEYAINKVAIQKINGGPLVAKIINTAIPPGAAGFQNYNPYPSKGRRAMPQVQGCSAGLLQANGIKLNYGYQNDSVNAANFQAVQASLKPCGINPVGQLQSGATFFTHVGTPSTNNARHSIRRRSAGFLTGSVGTTAARSWTRSSSTNCVQGTINYGC